MGVVGVIRLIHMTVRSLFLFLFKWPKCIELHDLSARLVFCYVDLNWPFNFLAGRSAVNWFVLCGALEKPLVLTVEAR